MDRKLFLIDGHSLIFRMYYAFLRRPMINSKGEDVSILYGFTKYVLDLLARERPTHAAVCFDPPGKTFRHQLYPAYKGTRQATPELVIAALDPLVEICRALRLPVLMTPGFEGDDILGSMAVKWAAKGFSVYMVTPDKDFGQLVSENIFQYRPGKSGAENEILGPVQLCEKLRIKRPSQVVDLLTICGDASDNVPGVNGVGEVGATKLLAEYDSVENIYAHLDELSPKQAELFRAAEDHIALSRTLVTIRTDVAPDVPEDEMLVSTGHDAHILELFDHYEFQSLKRYVNLAEGEKEISPAAGKRSIVWETVPPSRLSDLAAENGSCSIAVSAEGDGIFSEITSVTAALSIGGVNYAAEGPVSDFRGILCDESITKSGYNLKLADNLFANTGLKLSGRLDDVELMHYLIDPEKSHKLDMLCRSYLDLTLDDSQAEEAPAASLFDGGELPQVRKNRQKEAVAIYALAGELKKELCRLELDKLYYQMEEPLLRVLSRMERTGVRVDLSSLAEYSASLGRELLQIEARVRETVGEGGLNLSSPKQIGAVLFEKMRIDPRIKPGKQSYPTDEETLLNYADKYPVINDILEYRELKKLVGTYIEPFAGWVSKKDGRIHTTFNQALTATGRLSSSRPNLQNIPIRTERGKELRKAFVASSDDSVIVSADYSQIELRLMAHFCQDENMCTAFRDGKDVHAITASKIFKVPLDEVTADMRRTAKTANFGIMYGISAFGLAQRLGLSRVAAKKVIDDYFESFPLIQDWIERTRREASSLGYVQTLFGRRRYLPDINSRNATVRALAERNAVNAPIQGTAADIIKLAMNRVSQRMEGTSMKSRMILQIHDELLFETPQDELEEMMKILKQEMEGVISLSVPLTVECNYGKNWLEAH